MQLSDIMITGYPPGDLHTVARSTIRKCVYVSLERKAHAHDLPGFYSKLHREYGIKQRMAQYMNDAVKDLQPWMIECLDALTTPATLTQCLAISRAPFAVQERICEALNARPFDPRGVLKGFPELAAKPAPRKSKPRGESEATFQGRVVLALQQRYGLRIYLERRNVGAVVTRDRAGNKTGVFKASSNVGAADYHGYFDGGHPFELEFKAGTKQRDAQKAFELRMASIGVPYFLFEAADGLDACLDLFSYTFPELEAPKVMSDRDREAVRRRHDVESMMGVAS